MFLALVSSIRDRKLQQKGSSFSVKLTVFSEADNLILPDATSENDKKCSQINTDN